MISVALGYVTVVMSCSTNACEMKGWSLPGKMCEGHEREVTMRFIRRFGKVALWLFGLILAAVGVLFAIAPHPPATPKQVKDIAQMEAYLEKLVASGSPPGLIHCGG